MPLREEMLMSMQEAVQCPFLITSDAQAASDQSRG
jgi:hypothetical protein